MKNKLIDIFFEDLSEFEEHKPYLNVIGIGLIINIIVLIIF